MCFPSQCVLFCAVRIGIELALAIYNLINIRYFIGSAALKDYLSKICFAHKGFLLDDSEVVILSR